MGEILEKAQVWDLAVVRSAHDVVANRDAVNLVGAGCGTRVGRRHVRRQSHRRLQQPGRDHGLDLDTVAKARCRQPPGHIALRGRLTVVRVVHAGQPSDVVVLVDLLDTKVRNFLPRHPTDRVVLQAHRVNHRRGVRRPWVRDDGVVGRQREPSENTRVVAPLLAKPVAVLDTIESTGGVSRGRRPHGCPLDKNLRRRPYAVVRIGNPGTGAAVPNLGEPTKVVETTIDPEVSTPAIELQLGRRTPTKAVVGEGSLCGRPIDRDLRLDPTKIPLSPRAVRIRVPLQLTDDVPALIRSGQQSAAVVVGKVDCALAILVTHKFWEPAILVLLDAPTGQMARRRSPPSIVRVVRRRTLRGVNGDDAVALATGRVDHHVTKPEACAVVEARPPYRRALARTPRTS